MPAPRKTPPVETVKAGIALAITFVGGYVDVIGYISFFNTFTANMTGNTVHLSANLVQANWKDAALVAAVLAAFVAGSLAGRSLIEMGSRRAFRRIASVTLIVEALLILAVLVISTLNVGPYGKSWLLVMLAAAMGVQTATLTRLGPLTVHTTFVTGMINKLAQLLSHGLFLSYDLLRGREQFRVQRRQAFRRAIFIFSVWLFFFTGAICGAFMYAAIGTRSLFLALVVLGAAVVADQLYPLSLQEERDQSER